MTYVPTMRRGVGELEVANCDLQFGCEDGTPSPQILPACRLRLSPRAVLKCGLARGLADGVIHTEPVRTKLRHHQRRLRFQLGAQVFAVAANVRTGLLRDRDDRVQHL